MENTLSSRDRVGVEDFVLLEDFTSEHAFIDNLRKRFRENLIYTYIGPVLVSVNPYRSLPIYRTAVIHQYRNVNFYEVPPHVFAIADNAYRAMLGENRDQCILISGESGSGKTEASKKVLQYIAEASCHRKKVDVIRDKLLHSNPMLEAFGNAKTTRNDNSSRFGKYMDIEFNFMGDPVGGHVLNYLLEKSRVVHQAKGERNFHVFYQLLSGAEESLLENLMLKRETGTYHYLNQGGQGTVSSIDDAAQYQAVKTAMQVIELTDQEQKSIFTIVASVLHLGNVEFTEDGGQAKVLKLEGVEAVAKLLGCSPDVLQKALTHRTIEARGDIVTSPLNQEMALYARDALAKAVYDRLFTWLVQRLNSSLVSPEEGRKTLMGILDIYGFEIFVKNCFEQFCINYCNEKLHQLFIELTLKSEQEEYLREGIEWEPVEYFNNKPICDLIEEKHKGIISLLDEECLRPGDPTDMTFLYKMNEALANHNHFLSHHTTDKKTKKTIDRDEFRLVHYAGDVTYNVENFIDKNNDLLFRDLKEAMSRTNNVITQTVFPASELTRKKRPDTAATQFKISVNQLMDILLSKEPSYVRCIKPNDDKMSGRFDDRIVVHQVKYLGLMENLRVRRAGFAYRRPYAVFLNRYKCLCPETWPNYRGSDKEGVKVLVRHLQYQSNDYRLGQTKLFIRFPKTLFETEDAFQLKKHDIAAVLQACWRGYSQRKKYLHMRTAAIMMQKWMRRFLARKVAARRKWAAGVIRSFIKGFITRHGDITKDNIRFLGLVRAEFLRRLARSLPRSILDRSWPAPPVMCREASELLHKMHSLWLAGIYCRRISREWKRQLDLKVLAELLFKGKKENYEKTVGVLFVDNQLTSDLNSLREVHFDAVLRSTGERIQYCTPVIKYDRHGYKPRERVLIVTDASVYLLDAKDFKTKHCIPVTSLQGITVTQNTDNLLLLRIPPELKKDKGDLILNCGFVVEAVTRIVDVGLVPGLVTVEDAGSITHNMKGGQGMIDIMKGDSPAISKGKNGHLLVVV